MNSYLPLSEKQEKWLLDIAKRVRDTLDGEIQKLVQRHAAGDTLGQLSRGGAMEPMRGRHKGAT
ncbi:hypothetical protein BLA9940_07086 [Burkholderia aenigmatica]|jgi:hypothetical protein|uniref:Uncharacterized protein n=3 Tax=Burkholderia cepacia complex TaxID=87882 RepID=A0AA45BEC3_BURVI|nr:MULTISPECIES: hypothetical protein [Burkholderia cepacia complex]KKL34592.1 hypothetical protein WR31_28425 [Burkholderia contaminans LMG 23361]KVS21100.1 hypothetical protein WK32_19440 [Burkholderia vietnamiensis]OXI51789.1 hypothetical protein CFB47_38435 [Burkholderia sp. AU27893]PZW88447.1 hypothetical protein DFS13_1851 [Burkholderia sp. 28_3]QFR15807.1 hypothetical protein SK875_p00168 [Burkholderia contaminans]VWC55129.1 hypothetical protein BLA13014_08411 [Burkholderia aenigmatica